MRLVSFETSGVDGYRLRLRYPASWRRYRTGCVSSFTDTMVNVGVGEEHPLGSRTSHPSPGVTEIRCGQPIGRVLAQGAIAVTWTADAFPMSQGQSPLARVPGRLLRTSTGWWQKLRVSGHGQCSGAMADETITADLAASSDGYFFEMQACLRSPNGAAHAKQVLSMLHDARLVPLPRCATYYARTRPSTTPGVAPGIHAGPLQINLTPLRPGYPTKVLISARRPITSPITLTGVGCETGSPLRFGFGSGTTAISGTPPFSIATLERAGTSSAVIGPSPRAPYERTGYILFPTRDAYRIDLHQSGRIIRSVTVDEPGSVT